MVPPDFFLDHLIYFLEVYLTGLFIHGLVIHTKKPLNFRCHMRVQWTVPVVCLHALYVATLLGVTGAVRHIDFRFDELRDLWRGILVSVLSIGTLLPRFCMRLCNFLYFCIGCQPIALFWLQIKNTFENNNQWTFFKIFKMIDFRY